jgi:thymidylate synthase
LTAIQFLVRDGALECLAFMRSNDVIWGLSYDLYILTMLQELMASELGLELGRYTHVATSMHVYDHHLAMAEKIGGWRLPNKPEEMGAMKEPKQVALFLRIEEELRLGKPIPSEALNALNPYWRMLAEPLVRLGRKRHGRVTRDDFVESGA